MNIILKYKLNTEKNNNKIIYEIDKILIMSLYL